MGARRPGKPATGTKVHEVVRPSGRDYVADTVVTELDPGASYGPLLAPMVRSGLKKNLRTVKALLEA
jgi:hypothetical protein